MLGIRRRLPSFTVLLLGAVLAVLVASWTTGPAPARAASVSADRVAGADRYATAAAIAAKAFPDGAATVVLARGDSYPDALAAGPLAAVLHAPVLLTPTDSLSPTTAAEITALGASRAIVVGGASAVSEAVLSQLDQDGVAADRISGGDRYETAAAVARRLSEEVAASGGSGALTDALVVTGTAFPDALVAGTLAAADPPRPLLLVQPHALPSATATVLSDLGVQQADVIGGSAAVDDSVLTALRGLGVAPTRIAGSDRAGTAVAVAKQFASVLGAGAVTLARGDAFPDALVAAPWSGAQHRALLLTSSPSDLPDSTVGYLVARHGSDSPVSLVVAAGGVSAVTASALSAAVAAAGGHGTDGYRAREAYARMSPAQRIGQLFMVGVDSAAGPTAAELAVLKAHAVGSVFLGGRSDAGVAATRALTDHLRTALASSSPSGVGILVATDQEGGLVQVLHGAGFSEIPTALTQGSWSAAKLQSSATTWGQQLSRAGVDLDLAPVLDVVPSSIGVHNAPIGYFYREYGHTPAAVSRSGLAFAAGMAASGTDIAVKHFPGLGRVDGNTDTTVGVRDTVTTRHDALLQPFADAVRAGAPFVMLSSATYTRIDAAHIATFSPTVITGMLRHDLGFGGVVMSDSLTAKALSPWSPGTRAVRFLSAGGDLMLMTGTAPVAPMVSAVEAQVKASSSFAAQVHDAVLRVLLAKAHAGLL